MTGSLDEFLSKPFSALGSDMADHLGRAAMLKDQARTAFKAAKYDKAWELLHKQKEHYFKHATRCRFTAEQTIALDASVHPDLANILRLEGRNLEALIHILYFICAGQVSESKRKKLIPYFNRAKLKTVTISDIEMLIEQNSPIPDFRVLQAKIHEWANIQ